jgi:hypothetical protein
MSLDDVATDPQSVRAPTESFLTGSARLPSAELLLSLGCVCQEGAYGSATLIYSNDPADKDGARQCLSLVVAKMLASDARGAPEMVSLLSGAMRGTLGVAPASALQAYELSALALLFIDAYMPGDKLDHAVGLGLCLVLDAWLKPASPWTKLPGTGEVARLMFGEAFCALRLPDCVEDQKSLTIMPTGGFAGDIVWRERPLFLPGLCPAQGDILGTQLPVDLGPAP